MEMQPRGEGGEEGGAQGPPEAEGPLSFNEALDMAFGANREKVLRVVNMSTLALFCLSLFMLYMAHGDALTFNLLLGFLAVTVAFAAVFNWTMNLLQNKDTAGTEEEDEGPIRLKKRN
ncbi:hypothetical protein cyc_08288 [Cyclospora cayetanensis]|uniref:Transmembrane protein n=1 Tax=Cyclospora cayetanensis TaxID=88456 RepID=A0A1D3DA37_9EIME|nr:hypothetical protein cyc_08288 [Cyclospora cayetanensis]